MSASEQPSGVANGHADSAPQSEAMQAQANGHDEQPANGGSEDPKASQKDKGVIASRASDLKDKFTEQTGKVKDKTKPPGGFDTTPLPSAPPGYTVKFTFLKATNLPIADIQTAAADPFILATLATSVPRRHKEDPLMIHRTKTIRKTTEPVWNEEWIVANVPASGFSLKCRMYDEDWPDHNDRLGNVTVKIPRIDENWKGFGADGQEFEVKKRMGSKRAYLLKGLQAAFSKDVSMTPRLWLGIEVLGKSDPPHAQMYTVGPTRFVKHFSPMIGRLAGIKVNKDEEQDADSAGESKPDDNKKYDFQANELQLAGPVPPEMYHRYVEFSPFVGLMFDSSGIRGRIMNKTLHKQHNRIYNYDSTTEYGSFEACSEEASLQFLKMAHFDEGGRVFTYIITLDGLMRFTETGKEFGIDLLSKHTMHSDVATYIACSGEFFIRRLANPDGCDDPEPREATHPKENLPGGPPNEPPPQDPRHYQLIIDNDSGTYRPDKSILPNLKEFLEKNLPGLGIIAMHWEEEELKKLKEDQRNVKKKEGKRVFMVLNRSPSAGSFSSSDESRLDDLDDDDEAFKSKKERAFEAVENPSKIAEYIRGSVPGSSGGPPKKADAATASGGDGPSALSIHGGPQPQAT